MGIEEKWLGLVEELCLDPIPDRMINSGIKYYTNKTLTFTGEEWNQGFGVSLAELGYGGRSTKMNQLTRNYYNHESIESAKNKLAERMTKKSDYSSVMATMVGDEKDPRSQGHCMSSTIVTYNPKDFVTEEPTLTVDIYYRVTEVVKKFGADLIFLSQKVIPDMLPEGLSSEDITEVRFHFANIYFSPLFLPILVPQMDVIDLMYRIQDTQPFESLRGCYNALWTLTVEDMEHYSYRSRRHMHHFLINAVGEDKFKYIDLLIDIASKNQKLKGVPE